MKEVLKRLLKWILHCVRAQDWEFVHISIIGAYAYEKSKKIENRNAWS